VNILLNFSNKEKGLNKIMSSNICTVEMMHMDRTFKFAARYCNFKVAYQ